MQHDNRIGDHLATSPSTGPEVVLIGFPTDEGVRRNGGRVGASKAPRLIREEFKRMTPHPELFDKHVSVIESIYDMGDVELTGDLENDQQILGTIVASALASNQIPIILGGGHETAYGHVLGYHNHRHKISIINWDAHPDVRPLKEGLSHSGSPFRQALDLGRGTVVDYTVAGLQPQHVAQEHLEFLNMRKSAWFWAEDIDTVAIQGIYHGVTQPTMVSIDMDVVSQAFAPGVSAPSAGGLTDRLLLEIAYHAGRNSLVRSLDIVEVNPQFDRDMQTVRLAAAALWWFTVGLSKRQSISSKNR